MMNQKIMVVDDFYDVAYNYHKGFLDKKCVIEDEITQKISHILGRPVNIIEAFNEVSFENTKNPITANFSCDWIAVIYLTLPPNCVFKKGLSFYTHKASSLDAFPNEYAMEINGWKTKEDLENSFNVYDLDDWEEYMNIFVKYNRMILFRADQWHSYGSGFGDDLNNSLLYQKLLLKNI